MLDLDNQEVKLPSYTLKSGGEILEYDTLVLGFRLRVLEGVEDPVRILEIVQDVFDLRDRKMSTYEACVILEDFKKFTREEAEEPLKKVFGRSLFSDTTTDSPQEKLES